MVLNIGEDEYLTDIGGESGARIAVHHRRTLPHPDESGYLAEPGQVTSIGVKKVELKRMGPPHGACTSKKRLKKRDMFFNKYPLTYYSKQVLLCFQAYANIEQH